MSGRAASTGRQTAATVIALILIVSLFFMWGMANNLNDILIKQFQKTFLLSDFQSGLVQSAFYLGYFVFAMPAALFMRRFGYKGAVVCGLLLYAVGAFLFWPAAEVHSYTFFLFALFVIASGLAFLETSANPLITELGPPETAERRLNFAQAFNPLGSIMGVWIGREFIFSGVEYTPEDLAALPAETAAAYAEQEAAAVQGPYLVIGLIVLLWAAMVLAARFPLLHNDEESGPDGGFAGLIRFPRFLLGITAQFFYVGAQVGIWSYLIRYAQDVVPGMPEKTAADYLMVSLVLFMVGRFVGSALMTRVPAATLMAVFAGLAGMLMAIGMTGQGYWGLAAIVASSFFMSVMFPTIFALSLRDLGAHKKSGASLLVMAIIGGAILTAVMGLVSDLAGIETAFGVPLVCFAVVFVFALSTGAFRHTPPVRL